MSDPYQVVRDFEAELCRYTGSPFAVTVNSCTNALLLTLSYMRRQVNYDTVIIPKRTYVSVPMAAMHAGFKVKFEDINWTGQYPIAPGYIIDSARLFTSGMYRKNSATCVSFHSSKILGDTQGGAILHDNPEADKWFRKARFDGRTEGVHPKDDDFDMIGYHCSLSPDVAARLMLKLSVLPEHNDPLPNSDYPDLSQFKVFQ